MFHITELINEVRFQRKNIIELEETSVMVGMKDMLTSEKMYLEEVIKKAKLQLKKAGIQGDILENKLRISVDKERIRYYKCTPDNKKGSYILKKIQRLQKNWLRMSIIINY